MDPLSISAAIVGFLTFAQNAIDIIDDIKGAPEEFRLLSGRFLVLKESLQSVRDRIDQVKEMEAEVSKGGAFGRKRSTNKLFQRYREAVKPGGLYAQANRNLKDLFNDKFKKQLSRRERFLWTWKKDDMNSRLNAAIDIVRTLRDFLHDDDIQLQHATYMEIIKIQRGFEKKETFEILDWISPPNLQPVDARASKLSSVLPIPDRFVLSDPVYDQWLKDADSARWHFNCFGMPGSGKSHRARTVIDHLSVRFRPQGIPVLFFMFNHVNVAQQSLKAIYCRLLRHLLSQNPKDEIPSEIRDLCDQGRLDGQDSPSERQARDALVGELKKHKKSFLVVDALDEAFGCLESIHSALSLLRKDANVCIFSTTRLDPTQVISTAILCNACGQDTHDLYWMCLKCTGALNRKYDLCRECYQNKGKRCNDPSHIMRIPERINVELIPTPQEIEDFVRSSLKIELDKEDTAGVDNRLYSGYTPPLLLFSRTLGAQWQAVPKQISEAAESSYLVADLIIKRLIAQENLDGAQKVLQGLQSGTGTNYDEQYSQMLDLCLNGRGRESRKVVYDHFALTACTYDVLSFKQLSHAVAVQLGDRSINDFSGRCYSQQTVRTDTNGLLLIGDFGNPDHENVMFFHRTMDDYLKQHADRWFPNMHQMMFNACLAYLRLDCFAKPFKSLKDLDKTLEEYPFASYAASFWGKHLRNIPESLTGNMIQVLEMLNDPGRKQVVTQIALQAQASADLSNPERAWDVQTNVTPLHICAFQGLSDLCGLLVENSEDVDSLEESYGQSALHYACRRGHVDVVEILLAEKANTNVASDQEKTPLMEAIEADHTDVVSLLLAHPSIDVNMDAGGSKKSTALTFAAERGKTESVKKLLQHDKIQVNKPDGRGCTALAWAVQYPSVECVAALLQCPDIDATIDDNRVGMPLEHIAHKIGQRYEGPDVEIVKLFLKTQNVPMMRGQAVQYLIEDGRDELLKLLLEGQDYFDWHDNHGRTLFHIAATCGMDTDTVQLVYDILSQSRNFVIDTVDLYGNTPLHGACSKFDGDHGATAALLLQLGSNPLIKNARSQLAIDVAYQNIPEASRTEVSRIFGPYFPHGMDGIDTSPPITLLRIVATGDIDWLRTALNPEPTPLKSDSDPYTGWTVLHQTMYTFHGPKPEMLELLLPKSMPFLNTTSNTGRTCLHCAAQFACDKAVELLINVGVQLDIEDKWGDTAFGLAQRHDDAQCAFLLVKAGAKITKDTVAKDLVHRAVAAGDIKVVRKLVDIGVDIYYRKNGIGRTALSLAKDLYKKAFTEARHKLSVSGQWRSFSDMASFNKAAQDDPAAKAFSEIVEILSTARKSQIRGRLTQRDLSDLIEDLRRQHARSEHEARLAPPLTRNESATSPPPPYSPGWLRPDSMSPAGKNRSRSPSPLPSYRRRSSSQVNVSSRLQGLGLRSSTTESNGNNERLVMIVVVGFVAIAWMWLLLSYGVQFLANPRARNEL